MLADDAGSGVAEVVGLRVAGMVPFPGCGRWDLAGRVEARDFALWLRRAAQCPPQSHAALPAALTESAVPAERAKVGAAEHREWSATRISRSRPVQWVLGHSVAG